MEFKKTNENTIKVWVTQTDLKNRNISLIDLVENQSKIENFFYQILEEVDVDHEFQNNDLVSFQVLPLDKGFEMIISKDNDMVSKLTESNINFTSEKTKERFKKLKQENKITDVFDKKNLTRTVPIYFKDFEDIISAAKEVNKSYELYNIATNNSLLKLNDNYFLVFNFEFTNKLASDDEIKATMKDIDNQLGLIYEFGEVSKYTADELSKNGKVIVADHAISTLLNYFK